ncbi:MAG: sulfite oxidase-like oxidoreductase [Chloroflexi bacterium]|nr:sulfite oxidase-like oxidoreductase [Chloroflexota bacterium]
MAFDWLTRRQEREARRAAVADRVPPGQELTDKWPVLHYGNVPRFDAEKWDFQVTGLVAHPMRWSYQEFMALPRVETASDIHCVTGWSKLDNRWEGVSIREIVRRVLPLPKARYVIVHAEGGYTTNLPFEELNRPENLLAYRHNGEDLEPDHGWPLRLVVPHLYFWKSAKWVRGLEFREQDERGFWERYGYHNHGDPWTEERYSWQEANA